MTFEIGKDRRDLTLADHFIECTRLGGHLTVFDDSRFIITDDFIHHRVGDADAQAVASIFSRDPLVAMAALVPLGGAGSGGDARTRRKYAELFSLIEEKALNDAVRVSARSVLRAGFQDSRIRALEAELGSHITPARRRYGTFLDVVRKLAEQKISASLFRDEFLDFTYDVAGRLDFGIYSYLLDRIFLHPKVPVMAKRFLIEEVINFPPLIRRELLVNFLVGPGQIKELVRLARRLIAAHLDRETITQIRLLETLKLSRQSISRLESRLRPAMGAESPEEAIALAS